MDQFQGRTPAPAARPMKVLRAIGFANPKVPCLHAGQWLSAFDFDACDGQGWGEFTTDPARALRFDDVAAALIFWRRTSTVRPWRWDGEPNRPLTALTVEIEDAP